MARLPGGARLVETYFGSGDVNRPSACVVLSRFDVDAITLRRCGRFVPVDRLVETATGRWSHPPIPATPNQRRSAALVP